MITQGIELVTSAARAEFFKNYAALPNRINQLAFRLPSGMKIESFAWLGDTPQVREWVGSRIHKGLPELSFSITNKLWETTLDFDYFTWTSQAGAEIAKNRAQQASSKAVTHYYKLLLDVMIANGLCYDGQNFFDTGHFDPGASYTTVQDNTATITGLSSATACTALDAVKIVRNIREGFLAIKDGAGDESFGDDFDTIRPLILIPPAIVGSFNMAKNNDTIVDSGAPVDNDVKGTFDFAVSSKVGASDVYALLVGVAGRYPFIYQDYSPVQMNDNGSRVLEGETPLLTVTISTAGNVGFGDWRLARKAVRST